MEILYRDAAIAVVDKPAGLMVHDSALARGETDFAADRLRESLGCKIHLIHRLDRATSGCLLIAFEREVASMLGKQFMSRAVRKRYLAVCRGWPEERFTVDHPLDGGPGKPEKKPAVTQFRRLAILAALIATFVALVVTDLVSDGLTISGVSTWIAATVIVWLAALLAAFILPFLGLKKFLENRRD